MVFFGHLGLGDAMATPVRGQLPRRWVLLGTIAPDILDKPVYFAVSALSGREGWGIVRGTRSFGHTYLLTGLVYGIGRWKDDARWKALALGMATHPILDFLSDWAAFGLGSAWRGNAAFWPLTGWAFPEPGLANFTQHLRSLTTPVLLSCEALGLAWLLWAARRNPAR